MGSRFKPASYVNQRIKSPPTEELQVLMYGTFKKHTVRFQTSKENLLTTGAFCVSERKESL